MTDVCCWYHWLLVIARAGAPTCEVVGGVSGCRNTQHWQRHHGSTHPPNVWQAHFQRVRQGLLCGQPGGDPHVQALNVGCCSWCAHILTVHACLCCAGPPCSLSAGTCMALPLAVVAAVVASLGIQGWGCINSWDPPGTPACSADVGGTTAGHCWLPTGVRRAAMTSCTAGRCCSCKWHLLCLGPFHLLYLPAMCGCCCCQNQ